MALLLILFLLFGLAFGGSSSSSSSGSATAKPVPLVKCSKRMSTDNQGLRRCHPPANP